MAATIQTLAELIVELYGPPWVEALGQTTFLLTRIHRVDGVGEGVRWPVRYAGNASVGSYGETDAGAGSGNQAFKKAFLDWRLNKVEIEVTGLAQAVGAGGGMIAAPLQTELRLGLADLQAAINTELMTDGTGNAGKDITGLLAAIADTGVYAGLDRASYAWWKAYVLAAGGVPRALTEELMRQVKMEMQDRGGVLTAIYTSAVHWYQYGDLQVSQRRQTNVQTLTGGYQALDWEGVPIIQVPGYPTSRMDFIDERLLEYTVLKDFAAEPMAKTKDSETIWIKHYSQLVCRNPYRCGSLQDLST